MYVLFLCLKNAFIFFLHISKDFRSLVSDKKIVCIEKRKEERWKRSESSKCWHINCHWFHRMNNIPQCVTTKNSIKTETTFLTHWNSVGNAIDKKKHIRFWYRPLRIKMYFDENHEFIHIKMSHLGYQFDMNSYLVHKQLENLLLWMWNEWISNKIRPSSKENRSRDFFFFSL